MNTSLLNAALIAVAWVGSGLIAYGFLKAKIVDFERRLNSVEDRHNEFVTRVEYDNRHSDMIRQLERIEGKLDRLIK